MIGAAIDIGTNTSHIIIATVDQGRIKKINYRKRFYTYIAMDGIEYISEAAQTRLYGAFDHFRAIIDEHKVEKVLAVGTEALRSADNGADILDYISTTYDIDIEIVSGEREAQLIFQGVSQIVSLGQESSIIIDIGGGSVEFIYVGHRKVVHLESIPIGIARLYKQFHLSEPISSDQITSMYTYLKNRTKSLMNVLPSGVTVIGSAGTFEVLVNPSSHHHVGIINHKQFSEYYDLTISLDLEQRMSSPHIPSERARYIVAALVLVKFLFETLGCDEIIVSPYALKEGLIIDF